MNHYKGWYNACKLTVRLLWGFNLEAVKDTSCCPFSPCDLLDYENYNIGQEQWNIVDTLVTCGWSWLCFDDLAFLSHDMQSNAGQDCPTTASTGISLEISKKQTNPKTTGYLKVTAKVPVTMDEEPIKEIKSFVYLVSVIGRDVLPKMSQFRLAKHEHLLLGWRISGSFLFFFLNLFTLSKTVMVQGVTGSERNWENIGGRERTRTNGH